MIMCAQLFAKILFAPSFYAAWTYIPVLMAATVFSALSNFVGSVYLVEKRANMSLITSAIGAVLNVMLNLLLIPVWGVVGAAVASLVTQVFTNLIMNEIVRPVRRSNALMLKGLNPKLILEMLKR